MSQSEGFGVIVKKFEKKPAIDASRQTLITIKDPFPFFAGEYYVVTQDAGGDATARGTVVVKVEDHAKGLAVSLRAEYQARVSKEGLPQTIAQRIVDSIGRSADAQLAFDTKLRVIIGHRVTRLGGLGAFMSSFGSVRDDLVREVQGQVSQDLGLDVSLRVVPTSDGTFQQIKIVSEEFQTEISDYPSPIRVTFSASLEAVPGLLPHARQAGAAELAAAVLSHVRQFARTATLQQVHFEPDQLRSELQDSLKRIVTPYGRTITGLTFVCPSPISQPLSRTVRIAPPTLVFEKRVDYPRPIHVQCELRLDLVALGKYVRQGTPDLNTWAEQKFREVIERHLLDVSYIQLFRARESDEIGLQVFDRKKRKTEEAMIPEAAAIGYKASAIAVRTDLDFDELRREFRIKLEDATFELKLPDYRAALDVEVVAHIDDENTIKALFLRNADIKGEIERRIRECIRQRMKTTSPEEYYTQFRPKADKSTVIEELERELRKLLDKEFKATASVSCASRLTDLDKLFLDLSKTPIGVTVTPDRLQLTFAVYLRVVAADLKYWKQFQTRRPSQEQVQETVGRCIEEYLNGSGRDALIGSSDARLKVALNKHLLAQVGPQLGLQVEVDYLGRANSPEEVALLKKVIEDRIRQIAEFGSDARAELEALRQQRDLMVVHVNDLLKGEQFQEADDVRGRISSLNQRIRSLNAESAASGIGPVVQTAIQAGIASLAAAVAPPTRQLKEAAERKPGEDDESK